jgi:predicted phosphoserine aminotransferase
LPQRPILFTPGPTEVRPEVLEAMGRPVISHRGAEMGEMVREILSGARRVFMTEGAILLSTSSASGLMEGAIRNCVAKKSLHLVCGAFGERWRQVAADCGLDPGVEQVEAGRGIRPEQVEEALSRDEYDAVCLTHNETSTGVTNPVEEIARVVRRHPGVLLMVDAVSSLGGIPVEVDRLGIDVCFASVQKALALPPGFALCAVSDRALARARERKGRGYYFDFIRLADASAKAMPLATPSVSHLFALREQLRHILAEGLPARFARHAAMADRVRRWARERLGVLAEPGFESNTVTCVTNTRKMNVSEFLEGLRGRGFQVSNGYGNLKEATFRIGHMGEHTLAGVEALLAAMDEELPR